MWLEAYLSLVEHFPSYIREAQTSLRGGRWLYRSEILTSSNHRTQGYISFIVVTHLAIHALSLASSQACPFHCPTETNETNISNKANMVKKSQQAGGRPVGYLQSVTEDLNSGLPRNKSR